MNKVIIEEDMLNKLNFMSWLTLNESHAGLHLKESIYKDMIYMCLCK